MHEGKERRQQLIHELRTTHALQSPEQKLQRKEAESIKAKQVNQECKQREVWMLVLWAIKQPNQKKQTYVFSGEYCSGWQ